ncbi:protein singed wings 2 isoform X1 [Macrobrachium rosenbergii]|uniref:protein singed wings 2 isoform X1 n=1 Tax=Macrobrachium rosenbergii TaxID=79674 RepID=UPI0034D43CD7
MLYTFAIGWIVILAITKSAEARIQPLVSSESQKDLCYEIPEKNAEELEIVCSHVRSLDDGLVRIAPEKLKRITSITYIQSNFTSLTLDSVADLPSLQTISFNQSFVTEWTLPKAPSVPKVTTLVLSDCWNDYNLLSPQRNASLRLTNDMFDGLKSLEHLYLVNCYVSNMTAEPFVKLTSLQKFYITGGSGIGCEQEMEWVINWIKAGKAEVSNDTICFIARDRRQGGRGLLIMATSYSFSGHPFLLIMDHRKETNEHCPAECTCVVEGYNYGRNGHRMKNPIINIYCDNSGLTALPDIPPHSTRASFAQNNISDITKLFTSENYRSISSVRLQHNRISHLDSDLFVNFLNGRSQDFHINLSHNNFSTLSARQLLSLYKDVESTNSYYKPLIDLQFNPWDCSDCSFLPDFQELVFHQFYYREKGPEVYDNTRCAEGNHYFAGQMIVKLDVQSLCAPDPPLLQPIDILNISLGLIIILFVANFAHNVYQYRRHSKLPWIITKVPCC